METDPSKQNPSQPQNSDSNPSSSRFRRWIERHVHVEVDPPIPGLKVRGQSLPAKILLALFSILAVTYFTWDFSVQIREKFHAKPQLCPAIEAFIPDPSLSSESAFYQDGVAQRKGFEQAKIETEGLLGKLAFNYHEMKKDDSPDALLADMKSLYETNGVTYFIMTMSSKVSALRQLFKSWHDECAQRHKPEPILIATVASAPDVADASGGILRWYVRSHEESCLLAEFMRWKEAMSNVAVFYITRNARQSDDPYGKRGMEVFRDRFLALGGNTIEPISVTAKTAKTEVEAFLRSHKSQRQNSGPDMGAFVVGYGDMVKETISELVLQGFDGPIACASTLTEPDWQPQTTNADDRIFTVLPRLLDPQAKMQGDDKNVVFYFSKRTLQKVFRLTAKTSSSQGFADRWTQEPDSELVQEYLANGDTDVELDVVGSNRWR